MKIAWALAVMALQAIPSAAQPPTAGAPAYPAAPATPPGYPSAPPPATPPGYPPAPPPATGPQLVVLPMLGEKQIRQLVADVVAQLELGTGYRRVDAPSGPAAAPFPASVVPVTVLAREDGSLLRIGFVMLPRRLPQLWIEGLSTPGTGSVASRADVPLVQAALRAVLAESARIMGRLRLSDLESRTLLLSYVDADAALFVLRAMGYAAITDTEPLPKDDWYKGEETAAAPPEPAPAPGSPAAASSTYASSPYASSMSYGQQATVPAVRFPAIKHLPTTISLDRLPLIVRVPSTEARNLGLVGAEPAPATTYGYREPTTGSIPSVAAPLSETVAAGTQELLVLYHPDHPEQLHRVRKLLHESIDRPARQVYIEGLVVEVNRGTLDKLGVQWAAQRGQGSLYLGSTAPVGQAASALSFFRNSLNQAGDIALARYGDLAIFARIEALVSENRAEILSRPSVITLDNRQATIRVGMDLPVAEAKGSDRNIAYSFKSIPTGILLNVRPRVSEDGQEISMLIDATVSDRSPVDDLRVIDPDTNAIVVQAPAVQTRRVQTYARIRDNMPLIIGGLMSKTKSRGHDRVPLLGRIPILGPLFGTTEAREDVREVIIVLTPSVVSEALREAKAQHPRDDAPLELSGTSLFKEKVRIGAEDVLDSAHIRTNERFVRSRDAARRAAERDPTLAARAPFSQFLGARVPGEEAFVAGMLFRMLARRDAARDVSLEALRVFERDGPSVRPVPLASLLARGGDAGTFFSRHPGKALAIVFRPAASGDDAFLGTVPEVAWVDCAGRDAWRRMLWELNQPDARGARHAILIQEEDDLRRLRVAVAAQAALALNGGEGALTLERWVAGRMVGLQEWSAQSERVIDAGVARVFFVGEHAHAASLQEHAAAIERLDRALRAAE